MSQFLASGGQSTGVSASTAILQMWEDPNLIPKASESLAVWHVLLWSLISMYVWVTINCGKF